ncbi:uncharacterized protein EV422DRAFT_508825 [Fimicolochytrium jonesii]|uniref:uncharacterized protein n=1 Tax=Fimicolochytrium jonesii TaxID=1396493 RepID=UPI0022FE4BD8|nr:uncharacterized protein EV422DRAFT_508825 [Fimicolochytrium jonesii]KAI8817496.1 hypothetical protein EV422DRAFT_508825 [Fimicolochytrium jonesii]
MTDISVSIVVGVALSVLLAAWAVAHMLVLEQWTNFLYFHARILKRRTPLGPMTNSRRHLSENFKDLTCLSITPMTLLVHIASPEVLSGRLDLALRPLDIAVSVIGIYICFDVIYYCVHRTFHQVPFLYVHIHKRHHEDVPVHLFLTAKAEYIENILAVSPGISIWVILVLKFFPTLNLWTLLLPVLTLVMEFNTAHTGYLDHPLLYLMSPLQWLVKALPSARHVAQEHEEHHLTLKKNFAPIFSFLDRLGGTHSVPDRKRFATADVMESRIKRT